MEDHLLSITAVHPMREDAVRELIQRSGSSWSVVVQLIEKGDLKRIRFRDQDFYVRRFLHPSHGEE